MKFLATCVLLAAAATTARAAPVYGYVSPVILPKVHLASPDVTVVKQPYVIEQTEPVYRNVYYADPLSLPAVPYVSRHVVAYHQQPSPAVAYHQQPSSAVYYHHQQPVNYVV